MPHLTPAHHETNKHDSSNETKIKVKPQKCPRFEFKPHQVNESSQSNQETDHLVSQISTDGLPWFHHPVTAHLHLMKYSSISVPNLFALSTPSQLHLAHKQISKFNHFLNPAYPGHLWLNFGANRCPLVFMRLLHHHENIMAKILS
jgi:hypothetical protein